MRFEIITAFAIGILLPLLETCRRGMSEWSLDFTTMFTDYLAGTLLLIGYRAKDWGPLFLVIAWAWTTGMMVGSFSDQLEGTIRGITTEPRNLLVLVIKFPLLAISLVSLVLSWRQTSNRGRAQELSSRLRK